MTDLATILDFAIEREHEAVAFYQDLQRIVKFRAQKETLHEFELMELGHVRLLEGMKRRGNTQAFPARITHELHLADFVVTSLPVPDMTYQDILIIAMKKEEKAASLYEKLTSETGDPEMRALFLGLHEEEKRHRHHFEVIYDEDILRDN